MTTVTTSKTNGKAITDAAPDAAPVDIRGFQIPRPKMQPATVHIVALSPLIMHKWAEKQVRALEAAQTGKAKGQRAPKQPMQDALAAAYIVPGQEDAPNQPGKFYFPAPAFKHAFLYGVGQLDDIKKFPKTRTAGWMFMASDPIFDFEELVMRTDITRNPTQVTYRLMFSGWSADLDITYNANTITLEQVASLFDLGGTGGVGEWRPSSPKNKSGDFGRFRVTGVTEAA